MKHILLIGHGPYCENFFKKVIQTGFPSCRLTTVTNAGEAFHMLETESSTIDIVVADYPIPDCPDFEFFKKLSRMEFEIPSVILLDKEMRPLAIEAIKAGAGDFIMKDEEPYYLNLIPIMLKKEVIVFNEHLERKQIEAALKESDENFQKIFMLSPNPIIITTLDQGRIVEVNEIVLKTFDYSREEIIDKTLRQLNLMSLEDFEAIKIMLQRNGNFRDYELHMYSSSNQDHTCLSSGQLITFHGETCVIQTVNNITERKRMEKELLKSKNLESIGILAGGIARDFNDYLTSIMGNISIAKMSLHDGEKIHRALIRAEDISVKAAALASRLLTFSEGGEPIYREVTITHVIQEIVQYGFPHEKVKFDFRLKSGIQNVLGDETQLHQILTNILLNAIESMPNGGKITIEANNTDLPEENPYGLTRGNYVAISISDTGVGIPMENLDKIYDPFFSTKDSLRQNGIGLGLSICQSIINKHQGHIQVTSKIGEGTTVTLHIPAYTETPMVKER